MIDLERLAMKLSRDIADYRSGLRDAYAKNLDDIQKEKLEWPVYAHVELRPSRTRGGDAALTAYVDDKILGEIKTDDTGTLMVVLSHRNIKKPA